MLFKSLKVMEHQEIFKKMRNEKIDLSIIIPSYNEKNNLKFLINKSNKLISKNKTLEIILVDNGSTDGSKNFLQFLKPPSTRLKIVRVKKNIGYGYGIKYGLKYANGEIISWTHADLQFDINDIVKFYQKNSIRIKFKKIIIKGSRKNRSVLDIFFTKGMSVLVNLIFNTNINDINAQPKMFKKKMIKKIINYAPNDFSIDLFLLLYSSKNGYKIQEFPLKVSKRTKDKAKGGGSILGKIKLTLSTLRYIFSLKFNNHHILWK